MLCLHRPGHSLGKNIKLHEKKNEKNYIWLIIKILKRSCRALESWVEPKPFTSLKSVLAAADVGSAGKSSIFQKDFLFLFVVVIFSEDFREFLKKDLIEVSSLIQLEQCGRLNWWAETGTCQRLWPIGKNLLSFGYLLISKIYPG